MRIADLCCCAGGASMGLSYVWPDATIVGVDVMPQPNYPFQFVQGDALKFCLKGFDFVWASPPCQRYTQMLNHGLTSREKHPDIIDAMRKKLISNGKPWVIENVMAAPLRRDLWLCGEMFGLRVLRHRQFECSFPIRQLPHKKHRGTCIRNQRDGGYYFRVYGHETGKAEWGKAMGIDWMRSPELAQAIPPAYSQFIGNAVSWVSGSENV